jgi:hypothetical protein
MNVGTLAEVRRHVDTLSTILWNHGAEVEGPQLDVHAAGLTFSLSARMPDAPTPDGAELSIREIWKPTTGGGYRRSEYLYDLVERRFDRRRAFHAHDREHYLDALDVVTHEHCETRLGDPDCEHYYGLPVDAYEAIQQLAILWAQPDAFDCSGLRCIE